MNKYVDRGIIKWSPFDGLVGFVDMMEELRYKLGKKPRPELSDDLLAEMEYALQEALEFSKAISISYYYDGYLKTDFGRVGKLDLSERFIWIEKRKFKLDDIVNITVLE